MPSLSMSKTRYLEGLQCPRLCWCRTHRPEEIPAGVDAMTWQRFDQGHLVGEYARQLFPDGIEIPWGDLSLACRQTEEALQARRPIFEATFRFPSLAGLTQMRADILRPAGQDQWDLIEVKSTTRVKEVHLPDVAFQGYVAQGAGLRVRQYGLLHLSREYRRHGDPDPQGLFRLEDVTAPAGQHLQTVEEGLRRLFAVLYGGEPPQVRVGSHCTDPYGCPLQGECWAFLPERHVFLLHRGPGKAWDLLGKGILGLRDIPGGYPLTSRQAIQLRCEHTGMPHVDREALRAFLDRLRYPLYFLDFETFQTPIPLFDGLRPYDQVPFQFSLHVQQDPGAALQHHAFLADLRGGTADPRPEFLRRLRGHLGAAGSILAYNAAFEKRCLKECAEAYLEYLDWVEDNLLPRLVDLYAPFRAFHYYHPAQDGSASMKRVLPALTGWGYEEMEIGDGGTASAEFLRISLQEVDEADRQRVRGLLEEYCKQDTEGMVWMVEALRAA